MSVTEVKAFHADHMEVTETEIKDGSFYMDVDGDIYFITTTGKAVTIANTSGEIEEVGNICDKKDMMGYDPILVKKIEIKVTT